MYMRMIRERNYEINETRTLIEREQGKIETINVAVTINSEDVEEDLSNDIVSLISKGIGVPLANVEVLRAPFSYRDMSLQGMFDEWLRWEELSRQRDMMELIITWAVILLLGIAVIVLIATIYKGTRPAEEPEPVYAEGGIGVGMFDYTIDDDVGEEDMPDEPEEIEIDMQKKSAGLEQIERFIDKDPAAVAQLLRNWLTDE
jgi:flagellar M-ring protein FliF